MCHITTLVSESVYQVTAVYQVYSSCINTEQGHCSHVQMQKTQKDRVSPTQQIETH